MNDTIEAFCGFRLVFSYAFACRVFFSFGFSFDLFCRVICLFQCVMLSWCLVSACVMCCLVFAMCGCLVVLCCLVVLWFSRLVSSRLVLSCGCFVWYRPKNRHAERTTITKIINSQDTDNAKTRHIQVKDKKTRRQNNNKDKEKTKTRQE
jgi:hypothetical protein